MQFKGVEIVCPRCKGVLTAASLPEEQFSCTACKMVYPIIEGIPDLRVFSDPYIGIAEDREKGRHLAAQADVFDFAGLLDYYYQSTQVVTPHQATLYKRSVLAGEGRSQATLTAWERGKDDQVANKSDSFLEIGCGTGSLLVAAARRYLLVVGVDIAFRWLIVARKRLSEAGLDLPLICACAEALPFPEKSFDRIASESTLEHLQDQRQSLDECRRVIADEGHLFITTPNGHSLGPDPQTGIWAGSLMPADWVANLIARQGGIPPKRQLLIQSQLREMLSDSGFQSVQIFVPEISSAQRQEIPGIGGRLIDIHNNLRDKPIFSKLLLRIGPMLMVTAST